MKEFLMRYTTMFLGIIIGILYSMLKHDPVGTLVLSTQGAILSLTLYAVIETMRKPVK